MFDIDDLVKDILGLLLGVTIAVLLILVGISITRRSGDEYRKVKHANCVYTAMYYGKDVTKCEAMLH